MNKSMVLRNCVPTKVTVSLRWIELKVERECMHEQCGFGLNACLTWLKLMIVVVCEILTATLRERMGDST